MRSLRNKSKKKAELDGQVISLEEELNFDILRNYPPGEMLIDKWQRMCEIWKASNFGKRSKAGKMNRNNNRCRHTGGSMGFDEHRILLEKQKGEPVSFQMVFVDTHATKETKKRLREGEFDIDDMDQLEFVTPDSKESYTSFATELHNFYGKEKNPNQDCDELGVWQGLNPNSCFGIGSSDPSFVVTGIPSCGSSLYNDVRQSHEVKKVRLQLKKEQEARQVLETRLQQMEIERKQEQVERAKERAERDQEKIARQEERIERDTFKKQMDNLSKKLAAK